jgi:hypothetical protein
MCLVSISLSHQIIRVVLSEYSACSRYRIGVVKDMHQKVKSFCGSSLKRLHPIEGNIAAPYA